MVGAAIGGSAGLYNGIRLTTLAKETGKLRRTQYVLIIIYFSCKEYCILRVTDY